MCLIGIIKQSGGQLCTFKSNKLYTNGEFERGTTSESTYKSLVLVYYNRTQ